MQKKKKRSLGHNAKAHVTQFLTSMAQLVKSENGRTTTKTKQQ